MYKASLGTWLANNKPAEGYSITPQRSYRVYVKNYVNVEIKGYPLRDENQRKITVEQGWNNIGYTPMVNLPVTTALADYAASNGDVVKSREEFAIYTKESVGGGYWSGSLQYMKPGEGYMLYRHGESKVKFFYPFYEPGSNVFERTVAKSPAWRTDYGRNMTMVATAKGVDLQEGDPAEIRAKMSDLNAKRAEKQPLDVPSAGSTFKRPEGYYASALIDQCGLKGYSIGDAMVSMKHAGFLVNTGSSSADFKALMDKVQSIVEERAGVHLEPEIRIIGEEA